MVEKVIQTFEGLIRRSLAPSMTLLVLFVAFDLVDTELHHGSAWARALGYAQFTSTSAFGGSWAVFVTLALLAAVGVSYGLSALQQLLFDSFLKKNFEPVLQSRRGRGSRASEARALRDLRAQVVARLRQEPTLPRLQGLAEPSDYVLYEILGGIDPTDTRPFVDTAKATGITCVSLMLVLVGRALFFTFELHWWALLLLVPAGVVYGLGVDATLAQYRARALRLYANFLAMPSELIQRRLLQWGEGKATGAPSGGEPS